MRVLRILPLTIATAGIFLAVKIIDVGRGTEALSERLLISRVEAEQSEGEAPAKEEKKEEAKAEEPKKEEAKAEEGKKEEEHSEAKESKKEKPNPAVSETPGDVSGRHFSQSELDLLQNLSRRRDELDRWERNVQVKESALSATEKRIDEKIEQIESMKKAVGDVLAQYNAQEEAKLKSLVKIYESMKPDDAARIFDEVEMPILLLVIDKMAEKKAAPILAKMNSKKAKQITVELAEQRRLSTVKLNTIAPATATQ